MSEVVDIRYLDLADKVIIGDQITWGSFSNVFHGTLWTDGRKIGVAIKALRLHGPSGPAAKERLRKHFYREVLLWERLQHPNVVPLLGYTLRPNELPALVSPWYCNGNVIQYLESHSNPDRRALARDFVDGLAYLHTIPVAHGDLKGENVLVDADGRASICDFGMSQFMDESARIIGFTTSNGNRGGTDRFMCPELLEDKPKTPVTDMWAAGCLVVQILTDNIPYYHNGARQAVYFAIMRGDPPLMDCSDVIGVALWNCIKKCWSITPDERLKASEVGMCLSRLEDEVDEDDEEIAWLKARRASLCVQEIMQTEMSYRDAMLSLLETESAEPSPTTPSALLSHFPALSSASSTLVSKFEEDPSIVGVSAAFAGTANELERAMVGWSRVVGEVLIEFRRLSLTANKRKNPKNRIISTSAFTRMGLRPNSAFANLTNGQANRRPNRYHGGRLNTEDIAIMPTQRVSRYVMLFRDLLYHTPVTSPSRTQVERALEAATRLVKNCDQAQNHA